jgi:hypothetical protein
LSCFFSNSRLRFVGNFWGITPVINITSLEVARRLSEIFDGDTTRHLMLKGKLSNNQLITTDKPIGLFNNKNKDVNFSV